MEIEIITTKKKLSKTLLEQIPTFKLDEIVEGKFRFVCWVYLSKSKSRIGLYMLENGDYRKLDLSYMLKIDNDTNIKHKTMTGWYLSFTPENAIIFLEKYRQLVWEASKYSQTFI